MDGLDNVPEFNAANMMPTLGGLIKDLPKMIAERVDGIFRNLSREHITN